MAQLLKRSLEEAGVHLNGLIEDESTHTGMAFIQIADNGANTIVVVPGANMRLLPSDLDPFIPLLKQADFIVLQNEIPMETNLKSGPPREGGGGHRYLQSRPFPGGVRPDLPPG